MTSYLVESPGGRLTQFLSNERLYFFLSFFTEHDCQGESYVSFYIQLISQRSLNIRQITNQNVSFLQQEFEIENEPQEGFLRGKKYRKCNWCFLE